MDKLPRFDVPDGKAVFSPEGRLVRYSDHAATVERLTRERDLLWREHQKAGHECADLLAALTASEARVAEMREAATRLADAIKCGEELAVIGGLASDLAALASGEK